MTTVNANNNDDIERRIVDELDRWLDYISTAEERNEIVSGMQEKVYRTLQRVQMDGLVPILDFQQIRYVAESWLALVEIFIINSSNITGQ